ncbi:MAG: ABC transporter permease [Verrucomicrobia bacterium]|nr:ABC transporter permease [Cytophagales bacterium]
MLSCRRILITIFLKGYKLKMLQEIKVETYKLLKSRLFLITLFSPFVLCLVFSLYICSRSMESYEIRISFDQVNKIWLKDPWYYFQSFYSFISFLVIFQVCITTYTLARVETEAKGWKLLLTLPVERWKLFLSKVIIAYASLIFVILSWFLLSMFFIYITGKVRPEFQLDKYPSNFFFHFIAQLKIIICLFSVLILTYWANTRFKLGVAINIIAPTISIFASSYNPFTFLVGSMSKMFESRNRVMRMNRYLEVSDIAFLTQFEFLSIGLGSLFLFLAYWDLNRKKFY